MTFRIEVHQSEPAIVSTPIPLWSGSNTPPCRDRGPPAWWTTRG